MRLLALLRLVARGAVCLRRAFDPLARFGLAVLAGTVCLFHLACSRYDEPAVRPCGADRGTPRTSRP
ncbi:hypothetical protein ACIQHU_16595 [Streptomyces tendae]|uniref:hypothetical protein n=1 Tax=Streptomyces tendae TaxID=1932 RepID=UPI00343A4072